MRSRPRLAAAVALAELVAFTAPAAAVPLPRERHAPPQHRPPPKPHQAARNAAQHSPMHPQVTLSAHTSAAVPALVAEARKYMGTNPTERKRLWCATFMNFVLAKLGYAGTNSDAARSFAYYGRRISEPQVGAIAVLTRGRHGGHVGVVSGIDSKGDPIIISGNHNRLVGEAVYPRARVIAYVMPSERPSGTRIAASGPVSLPAAEAGLDSPITELLAAIEAEEARAEKPQAHREARPRAVSPAPPVPHRTVQQLPDQWRQVRDGRRSAGDPFSELIGALGTGKRRAL